MAGKLFKFLKKIKLNRKSENLLKKSKHPIKTDKFDNTIGLESWKVLTDELHEHDIIASNLNMDYDMTKPRCSRSTDNLPRTQSETNTTRQHASASAQLTRHQSEVIDSATASLKTIDVDDILFSDFNDGSDREPSSGTAKQTEEFESTDESQSMSSESNSSRFTATFTIHPTQTLENSSKQMDHINHSVESEETNEENSNSSSSNHSDSFTHVTESIYAHLEENSKSDELSAISVTELCESIRLISAFGSLPDLPANYKHRSTTTKTALLNNVNTPGRNRVKQVCQYCQQECKNRAGLISHQRMSKLCKVKQQEMNFFHVQVQTVVD